MCILLKDDEVISINDRTALQEYLNKREKYDKWFIAPINQMTVIAGSGTPEEFKTRTGSLISVDVIKDCMEKGTNLFLRFFADINGVMKKATIPLRYTAMVSLLERAKIGGYSIRNESDSADIDVLPLADKAKIINMCLALYHQNAKVLYRDEKLSSVMSGQYAILTEVELTKHLEEELKNSFENYSFSSASISHSGYRLDYDLNEDEIEEDIFVRLNELGLGVSSVKCKVGMFTSDIGTAACAVYAYLDIDGHRVNFGKYHSIKHLGSRTASDVKKIVGKLYNMFQTCPEDFKRLTETKIFHPAGCLRMIAKEMGLPKKVTMEVAADLELKMEATAYEIFWYLNMIASKFESLKGSDALRTIRIQELVSECIKLNFKKFDKEFEWARNENGEIDEDFIAA